MSETIFGDLMLWCEKCYHRIDLANFCVKKGRHLCPLCGELE